MGSVPRQRATLLASSRIHHSPGARGSPTNKQWNWIHGAGRDQVQPSAVETHQKMKTRLRDK